VKPHYWARAFKLAIFKLKIRDRPAERQEHWLLLPAEYSSRGIKQQNPVELT